MPSTTSQPPLMQNPHDRLSEQVEESGFVAQTVCKAWFLSLSLRFGAVWLLRLAPSPHATRSPFLGVAVPASSTWGSTAGAQPRRPVHNQHPTHGLCAHTAKGGEPSLLRVEVPAAHGLNPGWRQERLPGQERRLVTPEPRVGACQTQSPGWQLPGPAGAWVIPQEKQTLGWNAGFTSEECVRVLGAEKRTVIVNA